MLGQSTATTVWDTRAVNLRGMCRLYRCLDLEVRDFMENYMLTYIVTHCLLTTSVIFGVLGAVRTKGLIAAGFASGSVDAAGGLTLILATFAEINSRSSQNLVMMKSPAVMLQGSKLESCLIRKERVSMPQFRLRFGSLFFYDKMLILTTLKIVLENAIGLLLMD